MKLTIYLIALLGIGLIGCADSHQNEFPQNEVGLSKDDGQTLSGKLLTSSGLIVYTSSVDEKNPEKLFIHITLSNAQLNAVIRFDNESFELEGGNTVLNEKEKAALLEVASRLYEYIEQKPTKTVAIQDFGLVRMLEYWANAPVNYVHGKRTYHADRLNATADGRLGNEGVTCIRRNTTVTAEYDDSRGTHADRVRVGSKARSGYDCMGRCGADCGRWWLPSAWTKDCMDHDQCSNKNNSSGGSSDSNCGDEFDEAADDWIFGVVRGCRG